MISVVLYGRNDTYGYNLHKRAALSFNTMAEVLTDPSDEILFVDYNTPDDFPTFPEAIQDTLTERARNLLRILRVRPRIHERFRSKTPLVALEPVARNVAVRRSRPSNRWILSTNTDMIFVPLRGGSVTDAARKLADGIYHTPRIEIPEALWESLDRKAPRDIIDTVRQWGSALHLNEIVLGTKTIRYDGPGDFQLLLRSDLFNINGFDEEMLLGWHVDSNIAKRICRKYGEVGDFGNLVYGYHCDHTRQVTPAHSHARVQNDWVRFVDNVDRAEIPEQADSWGCANDDIEEIRLLPSSASTYVQALCNAIGPPLTVPKVVEYSGKTYNKTDYDPPHLMPFLADMFISMPRSSNVAWYGARNETLRLFTIVWKKLQFTGSIFRDQASAGAHELRSAAVRMVSGSAACAEADIFVFDFGGLPGEARDSDSIKDLSLGLQESFLFVVSEERVRVASGLPPRRIIALNAINNAYEPFVQRFVGAALTPYATHMRHGFVLPPRETKQDWLPLLSIGEAGIRCAQQIRSDPHKLGFIAYGPYEYLDEGRYSLTLETEVVSAISARPKEEICLVVELLSGPDFLGIYFIKRGDLRDTHRFFFSISRAGRVEGVETRIRLTSPLEIIIHGVMVEPAPETETFSDQGGVMTLRSLLQRSDWLPLMHFGPLASGLDEHGVCVQSGPPGFAMYGPYLSLPPGAYEMISLIECPNAAAGLDCELAADVLAGGRRIASVNFDFDALPRCEDSTSSLLRLPFEITTAADFSEPVETRIWSSGQAPFRISSSSIKSVERAALDDRFPCILAGKAGHRLGVYGEIKSIDRKGSCVAYTLRPGSYRLTFRVKIRPGENRPEQAKTIGEALVRQEAYILDAASITTADALGKERELSFEIAADRESERVIEFSLSGVDLALCSLILAPVALESGRKNPAPWLVGNWLPYLQTGPDAHRQEDGIEVREGPAGHVIYGPYWLLRPGRYELVAVLAPNTFRGDGRPIVEADIVAERGARIFAARKWHLGALELPKGHPAGEFRLPFELPADLPPESRTIETRLRTAENASFHIHSLHVRFTSDQQDRNWFPYLAAGENGLHIGSEIKSIEKGVGCIAFTPAIHVKSGHYKAELDAIAAANGRLGSRPDRSLVIEVWSGSKLLAIEKQRHNTAKGERRQIEFDLSEGTVARAGVDIRVLAVAPVAVTIRGLQVEKISDAVVRKPLPSLPIIRRKAAATAASLNSRVNARLRHLIRSLWLRLIRVWNSVRRKPI